MSLESYQSTRIAHWDRVNSTARSNIFNSTYHKRLKQIYSHHIPANSRVLEIGCGKGELLSALNPAVGVGIDFSAQAIQLAQKSFPQLTFLCIDILAGTPEIDVESFDFIILSDLLNDVWDVQAVFDHIAPFCHKRTRIILNYYSRVWQPMLGLVQNLGLAKKNLQQNWLTREDLSNMLYLSNFEVLKYWHEMLFPLPIPLLEGFFNKFLVKIWPFSSLALTNFMIASLKSSPKKQEYSVSVIVPARNEAGNIENILTRTPEMGKGTEIIFVEGNSSDDTYQTIESLLPKFRQRKTALLHQDGKGKGDAVRKGFAHATGDILMILDADLTVPPEDLPRFYEALANNKGDFINGVRLVYPMEKEAMRFYNLLGNKFFSMTFSWLLGQPIKDTLCGTKVLFRKEYDHIVANRAYFGDFDPFGDFDLIFGASRLDLKIVDMPIRYRERTYGTTNIQRWKHGLLLLKMVFFASSRIKFI
ncbi:MAG: glycosyl transferase [Chloroflexi bacterium 44-23]|nr:MAG: glycosyl transferase [Chloroflexi bacterium 44-23]